MQVSESCYSEVPSMAFTKFFIEPSVMRRDGSRILSASTRAGCWIFFRPAVTFSLQVHPFCK